MVGTAADGSGGGRVMGSGAPRELPSAWMNGQEITFGSIQELNAFRFTTGAGGSALAGARVHAAYYAWFGTPSFDGPLGWLGWNMMGVDGV